MQPDPDKAILYQANKLSNWNDNSRGFFHFEVALSVWDLIPV